VNVPQFENELNSVRRIQEIHSDRLLRYPNVVGIGTGFRQRSGSYTKDLAVQVLVSRKYPDSVLPDWAILPDQIRKERGSARVDVIDVGFVYPTGADTTRYRPVEGGCSIGHQSQIDAGTLGAVVADKTDNTFVLLTCNHCIAAIGTASQPGNVLQPGQVDGGAAPNDVIGSLKRFVPISTANANFPAIPPPVTPVDAAIGTLSVKFNAHVLQIAPAIFELGTPSLGTIVQKRGRTTGLTTNGTITSVNVLLKLNYVNPRTFVNDLSAAIANAFVISPTGNTPFAAQGDSGSVIFDTTTGILEGTYPAVGVLFAGSSGGFTWANDINVVFNRLNLDTVCSGLVKLVVGAVGERRVGGTASLATGEGFTEAKLSQLRSLRDDTIAPRRNGAALLDVLGPLVPVLFDTLIRDEEAFGLLVRLVAPWVAKPTNLDVLEAQIDEDTVGTASRLAQHLARISPELRTAVTAASQALAQAAGSTVRELLEGGSLKPPTRPKASRSRSPRRSP
jgi:hypothetical protein